MSVGSLTNVAQEEVAITRFRNRLPLPAVLVGNFIYFHCVDMFVVVHGSFAEI